jgi:hypothetical protein
MSEEEERGRRNRGGGARPLGQLLAPLIRPLAKKRPAAEAALLADWPAVVGEELARLALPIRLRFDRPSERREGVLELACDSASAVEVQHLAPQFIGRVNAYLGYPAVARLRLRQKGPGRAK